MDLQSGARLGPYEIVAPLGSGGMGQVYLATDTRLGREVAIKVLSPGQAAVANAWQRFEREARAVSSLSHPHICALYDVGRDAGTDFLVMEHLEGESLADRLLRAKFSSEEVLSLGAQIADALDHAHRRGIVHRDVKPGNIMITRSGAKVLDFGLAKLHTVEQQESASADSPAPTRSHPITGEGTILGTLQYIAPEQLEGKEADARSDVFAFGAVLYEMATGRRAFDGESRASIIAAILEHHPPSMSELNPMVPPALGRLVHRCLAKGPEDRWQSARDVALELRWIASATNEDRQRLARHTRRRMWPAAGWVVAVATILIGAVAWALIARRPAPRLAPLTSVEFIVPPPPAAMYEPTASGSPFSLSPDGRRLALVAVHEGQPQIWVRRLDGLHASLVRGTEGAEGPFWSPDGRFIGFFANGNLMKVPVEGGLAQRICEAPPRSRGGTWAPNDTILFGLAGGREQGIGLVPASGGKPTMIVQRPASQQRLWDAWPSFLPDGRHFIWLAYDSNQRQFHARLGSLDSDDETTLFASDSRVVYAEPGYLLYVREGVLVAQAFDTANLRPVGQPIPIADDTAQNRSAGAASFSVSATGVLARQGSRTARQLKWVDPDGRELDAVGEPRRFANVRLSPDATRAATSELNPRFGTLDVWIVDLVRKVSDRLTVNPDGEFAPVWSPDGSQIVFTATWDGAPHLYLHALGKGSGPAQQLLPAGAIQIPTDWSPDGRFIVYQSPSEQGNNDLWLLDMGGRRTAPLLATPFNEHQARFSDDGGWLAYVSDDSGRPEVYVRKLIRTMDKSSGMPALSEESERHRVSTLGGQQPSWGRFADKPAMFFVTRDDYLVTVPLTKEPDFDVGEPQVLFKLQAGSSSFYEAYEVGPDGKRFLLCTSADGSTFPPIIVETDWTSRMK